MEKYDLLIFPSTNVAPLIKDGKSKDWFSNILTLANLSGCPSISIPLGKENKMPFGLSLETGLYQDKELLSYALYIEKILGGNHE